MWPSQKWLYRITCFLGKEEFRRGRGKQNIAGGLKVQCCGERLYTTYPSSRRKAFLFLYCEFPSGIEHFCCTSSCRNHFFFFFFLTFGAHLCRQGVKKVERREKSKHLEALMESCFPAFTEIFLLLMPGTAQKIFLETIKSSWTIPRFLPWYFLFFITNLN